MQTEGKWIQDWEIEDRGRDIDDAGSNGTLRSNISEKSAVEKKQHE